jgi:polysaccharide pyruvyl transferase CsaB
MRVLLVGYYGAGNLGDELSLRAARALLADHGIPDASIRSLDLARPWRLGLDLLSSDAIIFGGGSLLQNITSQRSLAFYCGLALIARALRKRVLWICQGIGPLRGAWARWLARMTLSRADFVSFRELGSEARADLASLGRESADLVWLISEAELSSTRRNLLLVSLRTGLSEEALEAVQQFLGEQRGQGWQIATVALQASDAQVLRRVCPEVYPVSLHSHEDWLESGRDMFERAGLCLGMRLHSLVLAIGCGVPCTGISYDPKVRTLCQEAGLPYVEAHELRRSSDIPTPDDSVSSQRLRSWARGQGELVRSAHRDLPL